jgi:hypothetical protein
MSDIAKAVSAGMTAFNKIGRQNGSAMPQSDDMSNTAPLVYEMLIASRLKSLATARDDEAKKAAREAGILQQDYDPGDHAVSSGCGMVVNVKRNKDSTTVDNDKLRVELIKRLGEQEAAKLLKECSKPRKGNTTISVALGG